MARVAVAVLRQPWGVEAAGLVLAILVGQGRILLATTPAAKASGEQRAQRILAVELDEQFQEKPEAQAGLPEWKPGATEFLETRALEWVGVPHGPGKSPGRAQSVGPAQTVLGPGRGARGRLPEPLEIEAPPEEGVAQHPPRVPQSKEWVRRLAPCAPFCSSHTLVRRRSDW